MIKVHHIAGSGIFSAENRRQVIAVQHAVFGSLYSRQPADSRQKVEGAAHFRHDTGFYTTPPDNTGHALPAFIARAFSSVKKPRRAPVLSVRQPRTVIGSKYHIGILIKSFSL